MSDPNADGNGPIWERVSDPNEDRRDSFGGILHPMLELKACENVCTTDPTSNCEGHVGISDQTSFSAKNGCIMNPTFAEALETARFPERCIINHGRLNEVDDAGWGNVHDLVHEGQTVTTWDEKFSSAKARHGHWVNERTMANDRSLEQRSSLIAFGQRATFGGVQRRPWERDGDDATFDPKPKPKPRPKTVHRKHPFPLGVYPSSPLS
ncbi:hypothetical protein K488DRAFT_75189 [Vararia minispora EC-137]|uniref:Uncharacterized protein n=1 Tax=Vararia minispora EC-137 TaxID=1314806 RepID=A0ACB8Q4K5_9AGAM|nr:hypothetical protein K488DRAFT_75189 [Vararia minispora EC-137]